jgi:hypothetical protein
MQFLTSSVSNGKGKSVSRGNQTNRSGTRKTPLTILQSSMNQTMRQRNQTREPMTSLPTNRSTLRSLKSPEKDQVGEFNKHIKENESLKNKTKEVRSGIYI